jgi:8-oxo-dGTP diphosphatase
MVNISKEACVVFMNDQGGKFLLQLRDQKPNIVYPGHWGAFGGEINSDETPEAGGIRELREEIGFSPSGLNFFKDYLVEDWILHVFYCELTLPLSRLSLNEGSDMGLFCKEEILDGKLYSEKMKRYYPIVPAILVSYVDFFEYMGMSEK